MSLIDGVLIVKGSINAEFSPALMKRTMRLVGQDERKFARKLIARRSVSAPGAFPGRVTGEMQRSVRFKLSRSGWSVRVASYRTPAMQTKDAFYPAFLVRGVPSHGLAARKDYIQAAYDARLDWARAQIASSLIDGVELK